jgi:hypothetical protein
MNLLAYRFAVPEYCSEDGFLVGGDLQLEFDQEMV